MSAILNDGITYKGTFFDVMYPKPVTEHLYYQECIFREIFRVLKYGGAIVIAICLD